MHPDILEDIDEAKSEQKSLRITSVKFGRLISGPGFENRSLTLEASVESGQDWIEVLEALKEKVAEGLQDPRPTAWQKDEERAKAHLADLREEIEGCLDWINKNRKLLNLFHLAEPGALPSQTKEDTKRESTSHETGGPF